jgi:hypothetical protein
MDNVKEIPNQTPQVLSAMVMKRFETTFLRQCVDWCVCTNILEEFTASILRVS